MKRDTYSNICDFLSHRATQPLRAIRVAEIKGPGISENHELPDSSYHAVRSDIIIHYVPESIMSSHLQWESQNIFHFEIKAYVKANHMLHRQQQSFQGYSTNIPAEATANFFVI